jgi:hypothetical protein
MRPQTIGQLKLPKSWDTPNKKEKKMNLKEILDTPKYSPK